MKIYLLTLGCAKNRVDSECLAGALKAAGHELVPEVEQAQAAIVNTCGFIRPAVEESIEAMAASSTAIARGSPRRYRR